MKKLIIINGTPGVGKTTISETLNKELRNSVWLDGDWCWMMNPFIVNDENKLMVENNINHLLNNFLKNSSIDNIVFNWVIPHDELMDSIIEKLVIADVDIIKISLICDDEVLRERLRTDNSSETRIQNSIDRQNGYFKMDTIKIDTSDKSVLEVVKRIGEIIEYQN